MTDPGPSPPFATLSEVAARQGRKHSEPHSPRAIPLIVAGAAIYRDQCFRNATVWTANGVAELFPSIANSTMTRSGRPDGVDPDRFFRGARSVGTNAAPTAPGIGPPNGRQLDNGPGRRRADLHAKTSLGRRGQGRHTPAQVSNVRRDTASRPTSSRLARRAVRFLLCFRQAEPQTPADRASSTTE